MARIRADYVFGSTNVALADTDTTLSSPGLAALPEVTAPDVAAVVIHDGTNHEIVHVTAHTAAATTATILRAQEGTAAQAWDSGADWNHAPTATDFAGASAPTAADVSYAGSTNLAATDVEAALDELDAEKVQATSTITKLHGPITQAAYDALTPAADTVYIIVG